MIKNKICQKSKRNRTNLQQTFTVAEKLTKPHPLVKAEKVNLNAQKKRTNWRNLPECIHTDRELLSISVQKHNVNRALKIMDAFIKIVEYKGHEVVNDNGATKLIVDGEKFPRV